MVVAPPPPPPCRAAKYEAAPRRWRAFARRSSSAPGEPRSTQALRTRWRDCWGPREVGLFCGWWSLPPPLRLAAPRSMRRHPGVGALSRGGARPRRESRALHRLYEHAGATAGGLARWGCFVDGGRSPPPSALPRREV